MSVLEIYRPKDAEEEVFFQTGNIPYNALSRTKQIDYSRAKKKPQIYAALAANAGSFLFGCSLGWSSPVQPEMTQNINATIGIEEFGPWFIDLNDMEMSWVSSLLYLGALIGALIGGFLMNSLGRKTTLMCTTLPSSGAWVLIGLAQNKTMLYFGRFFCGLSGGICSVVVPCYIAEVSTPKMRGSLGTIFTSSMSIGILTSSIFGFLPWRWMTFFFCILSCLIFGVMFFVPESPYFLLWKPQKWVSAAQALQCLRGPDYDIKAELDALEGRLRADLAMRPKFDHLFLPWNYRPLLISIALMICQAMCGIGPLILYTVEIFQLAASSLDGLLCALILNLILVVWILGSTLFAMKRVGRRPLFLISAGVTCICCITLGTYFYYLKEDPETAQNFDWVPLVVLSIFMAAFSLGVGPLPWIVSSEILPSTFRGPGTAIPICINWMLSFIVTKTFTNMQFTMGIEGTFWLFGGFCFSGFLFGIFFLPETKGKAPERIQSLFER